MVADDKKDSPSADNGWRLENAKHLKGRTLALKRYFRPNENWDHDHCVACWAKVAEFEGQEIIHEGYVTLPDNSKNDRYQWWICPECFSDLSMTLGWAVT